MPMLLPHPSCGAGGWDCMSVCMDVRMRLRTACVHACMHAMLGRHARIQTCMHAMEACMHACRPADAIHAGMQLRHPALETRGA